MVELMPDSVDDNVNDTATTDTDLTRAREEQLPLSRYPRRIRRPPPDWFMVTTGTPSVAITVTTSDEPLYMKHSTQLLRTRTMACSYSGGDGLVRAHRHMES